MEEGRGREKRGEAGLARTGGVMGWIRQNADGVVINVRIVPRASRNELSGLIGDELKVRLQSPPVKGKANKALVKFIAGKLGVSSRAVAIVSGLVSRNKRLLISGMDVSSVGAVLMDGGAPASDMEK